MLEYLGVPAEDVLRSHFEAYTPFVIRNVTQNILTGDLIKDIVKANVKVEASVIDNAVEEYSGDVYNSKYYSCAFKSFVGAYTTKCKTSDIKSNDRKVYLAQSSIYESTITGQNKNSLYELYPYVNKEPFLSLVEILQINLWMNLNNKSCSALHFDEYHNFLVLHYGTKFVKMISPEYTMNLKPNPAHTITPHHSKLSWNEISNSANNNHFKVIEVEINSGDVLFIPEGYWHAVESIPYSIAVNYWFKSPLHKFIHGVGTKLDQYLIRYFVQSTMKSQIVGVTSSQEGEEYTALKKRKLEEGLLVEQHFSNFVEKYYNFVCDNNIAEMRKHEKRLASIDMTEQRKLFPTLSASSKIKFHRVLESVTPVCAHALTEKWETCDDTSFFTAIFEGNDSIVESLMLKKDALNKAVCDDILSKLVKGDE